MGEMAYVDFGAVRKKFELVVDLEDGGLFARHSVEFDEEVDTNRDESLFFFKVDGASAKVVVRKNVEFFDVGFEMARSGFVSAYVNGALVSRNAPLRGGGVLLSLRILDFELLLVNDSEVYRITEIPFPLPALASGPALKFRNEFNKKVNLNIII